MQTEVIIAGFGGQGVLFAGQLLAYAALGSGLETTWIPSYGPEMRGGTANCTVVISDEEIGSPYVRNPAAIIAFNQPSLDKYEPMVRPGGLLVVNASIIPRAVVRTDVDVIRLPGNELAEGLGERKLTNMVLLGALLARLSILPLDAVETALKEHLPTRHHHLLPANYKALRTGATYAAQPAAA
jgi:2-oxoglutarate ferredoxin oxidoreductase subunit gamma